MRWRDVDDVLDRRADPARAEVHEQQAVIGESCGTAQTKHGAHVEHRHHPPAYSRQAAHL
jgi:hypothetical protein